MNQAKTLRVLLCIGVLEPFFETSAEDRKVLGQRLEEEFGGLGDRFGIEVIGTFDDDWLAVGPSPQFPFTCYLLVDAPDLDSVVEACNLMRAPATEGQRLCRYFKIEARIGHPLFFGTT